jgi:hypothetical protein
MIFLTFLVPQRCRSSENNLYHSETNDHQVIETIFINGVTLPVLRMENELLELADVKQFDYAFLSVDLS